MSVNEIRDLSNSDYSLTLCRWILRPIGAWPSSPLASRLEKIVPFIVIIVCSCSILFTVIPSITYLIMVEESFIVKMKTLGPLIHWLFGGVQYTTLIRCGKDIRYSKNHIETDWRTVTRDKDRRVMLRSAKFGRNVACFYAVFMQSGILFYCIVTAFSKQVIQIGNETMIVHPLPCAVYKKWLNVDDSFTYDIILASQLWSAFIVTSSVAGVFGIVSSLTSHACGQLHVLMIWITEFVNDSGIRRQIVPFKGIGIIVEHHLRVLNFIAYIEEVFNPICFLELFRCIMAICVLGFFTFTEWDDGDIRTLTTYFLIIIATCFNTFILCYVSELVTEQSEKIGQVIYMTNWYHLSDKTLSDLIFIVARSSMVIHITALKFVPMSVYTFAAVMKSAFAYLNLLCQMQ